MLDKLYSITVGCTWIVLAPDLLKIIQGKAWRPQAFPYSHRKETVMRTFTLLLFFLAMGCTSCSHTAKVIDSKMSAIEAHDFTAITSGGGQQLAGSGYITYRETEGQNTAYEFLIVHTPPDLNCSEAACTFVKLFFQDGRPALEKSIPKGEENIKIPWSEITGKPVFDLTDRGTYSLEVKAKFIGPDGFPRDTAAEGMVYMFVVRKGYTSLIDSEDDEAFYWIWKTENNQTIKVTTSYRVYVEPYLKPVKHVGVFER